MFTSAIRVSLVLIVSCLLLTACGSEPQEPTLSEQDQKAIEEGEKMREATRKERERQRENPEVYEFKGVPER